MKTIIVLEFFTYTIYGARYFPQFGPSNKADSTIAGYVKLGTFFKDHIVQLV